jgi:hypothetical protein
MKRRHPLLTALFVCSNNQRRQDQIRIGQNQGFVDAELVQENEDRRQNPAFQCPWVAARPSGGQERPRPGLTIQGGGLELPFVQQVLAE